jgi:hypothetical protein
MRYTDVWIDRGTRGGTRWSPGRAATHPGWLRRCGEAAGPVDPSLVGAVRVLIPYDRQQ